MEREGIPPGLTWLTKKQRTRIGQLGSEWTALDVEENRIIRLIGEQYRTLRHGTKRRPELVKLERRQRKISKRKREVSAELIAIEEGDSRPKRRPPGRRNNPFVEVRDRWIREWKNLSNEEICRKLDLELIQSDRPPLGFPENWTEKYSVKSYLAAYKDRRCKALVQKLISVAKNRY